MVAQHVARSALNCVFLWGFCLSQTHLWDLPHQSLHHSLNLLDRNVEVFSTAAREKLSCLCLWFCTVYDTRIVVGSHVICGENICTGSRRVIYLLHTPPHPQKISAIEVFQVARCGFGFLGCFFFLFFFLMLFYTLCFTDSLNAILFQLVYAFLYKYRHLDKINCISVNY